MDLVELRIRLKLGKSRTVVIFCELCSEYPGYVKTITIMDVRKVRIEYNVYGYDEAGVTYFVEFENENMMIESMERYIGKSFADWRNINLESEYPRKPDGIYEIGQAHNKISEDIRNNKIKLPVNGTIRRKEDGWRL